jgi:hypothetical protein
MGLFSTLIRKRQSQVDRVFRDRLAAFDQKNRTAYVTQLSVRLFFARTAFKAGRNSGRA